jgi:hypothetical protein
MDPAHDDSVATALDHKPHKGIGACTDQQSINDQRDLEGPTAWSREYKLKVVVSRLSWNWRKRSSVKITERTYEEGTEAFHTRRKSSHLEAASCGQSTRLGAV